ncbi:unnamed protein product [Parnassius mnemosyne]|uniref:Uncharacterized protein n=1 Tax=Parnassius mnemosyne TaxID=213953 RepID=A0AAV1L6Q5_9NEOP
MEFHHYAIDVQYKIFFAYINHYNSKLNHVVPYEHCHLYKFYFYTWYGCNFIMFEWDVSTGERPRSDRIPA